MKPVTVAIVCRDEGALLEDAVDSAYAQRPAPAEILVVDDGSLDPRTRELVAGYRWPRLRVVRLPGPHAAAARNRALHETATESVCIMSAAERLQPGFLAAAHAEIEDRPAAAGATAWFRTNGTFETEVRAPDAGPAAVLAGVLAEATLWRRAAVLAIGGFDEGLEEGDETADLRLRLAKAGHETRLARDLLIARRLGAGSAPAGHSAAFGARHADLSAFHAAEIAGLRAELLAALWSARPAPALPPGTDPAFELAEARRHIAGLEHALSHAHRRLADLGASWSWRVTAPLRAVHARLTRDRGPR